MRRRHQRKKEVLITTHRHSYNKVKIHKQRNAKQTRHTQFLSHNLLSFYMRPSDIHLRFFCEDLNATFHVDKNSQRKLKPRPHPHKFRLGSCLNAVAAICERFLSGSLVWSIALQFSNGKIAILGYTPYETKTQNLSCKRRSIMQLRRHVSMN
jgi:hypothetical protein